MKSSTATRMLRSRTSPSGPRDRMADRWTNGSRKGAVLVCVLVCLLVVSGLLANMMRAALRTQRQLHFEQTSRQVDCLLDAGLSRAAFQVRQNRNYDGETWRPAPEVFGMERLAEVKITLQSADDPQSALFQVVAEYPVGSVHSIRRTSRFTITSNGPDK